jgi:hypothetical protein
VRTVLRIVHRTVLSYTVQDVAPLKLTAFGGYTRGDLEMLGNVFLEFDVDGDKTITYDEFVKTANSQLHGKVVHGCTAFDILYAILLLEIALYMDCIL